MATKPRTRTARPQADENVTALRAEVKELRDELKMTKACLQDTLSAIMNFAGGIVEHAAKAKTAGNSIRKRTR